MHIFMPVCDLSDEIAEYNLNGCFGLLGFWHWALGNAET